LAISFRMKISSRVAYLISASPRFSLPSPAPYYLAPWSYP
jgi:hypothetical protein